MTLYRVNTGIQRDGHAAHGPDDEPSELGEFDAAWLAWAVQNGIVVVVDGEAPTVAEPEPTGEAGPVYREHWHGDPALAPEGTWEHEWRQQANPSPSPSPDKGGEEKGRRRKGSEE